MRTLERTVQRTGVLQLDSVNVLARAHLMPLFSRMGPYDTGLLTRAAEQPPRRLVEYWAHVAAFMPVELWPHMQPRMRRHREQSEIAKQQPELVRSLLEEVRQRGPSTSRDLDDGLPRDRVQWGWNWSSTQHALTHLFGVGDLAVAGRNSAFERIYDLPERVLPPAVLAAPTPSDEEAHRELVRRAARSFGVATELCLRDYFRLPTAAVRPAVRSLVEDGELIPVEVRGVGQAGVPAPRRPGAAPHRRPHPAQPVRPRGVGARPHREAVRVPLPDRDLRPRAPAPVRLLRAAVPARRGARGAGRPQGRPQGARARGQGGPLRARGP